MVEVKTESQVTGMKEAEVNAEIQSDSDVGRKYKTEIDACIAKIQEDEGRGFRQEAVRDLGACGAHAASATAVLEKVIEDADTATDFEERFLNGPAEEALQAIKTAMQAEIQKHVEDKNLPALLSVLRTKGCSADILVASANALSGLGERDQATTVLEERLKDEKARDVLQAASALSQLGETSLALQGYMKCVEDVDNGVVMKAADALSKLGESASAAQGYIKCLDQGVQSVQPLGKDQGVRLKAVQALGKMGAQGVPGLAKALQDSDAQVRYDAVNVLCACGAHAASATAVLEKVIEDDNDVNGAAKEALQAIQTAMQAEMANAAAEKPAEDEAEKGKEQ